MPLYSLVVLPTLPLLAAAAALLLAHSAAPQSHRHAIATMLGALLIASLALLLMDGVTLTGAGIGLFATGLACLPLLDRGRMIGLVAASAICGITFTMYAGDTLKTVLPRVSHEFDLYIAAISAGLFGLAMSAKLPMHPSRITTDGLRRENAAPHPLVSLGAIFMALTLASISIILYPANAHGMFIAALAAGLLAAVSAPRAEGDAPLRACGEAMSAGVLLTSLVAVPSSLALVLGGVAGLCSLQTKYIAHTLRIDDPSHSIGLLIPAMLGALAPGFADVSMLSSHIMWLGAAIVLGLASALVLWPLLMLLFGFALPPRLVKEGVR